MGKLRKFYKLLLSPKELYRKVIHRILTKKIKNLILKFPNSSQILRQIQEEFSISDKVVIFPGPNCPWGYMFQRPQQLARAYAKRDFKVIYMVDTSFPYYPDWNVRGLMKIENNLFLYNDNNNGNGLLELGAILKKEVIIWQYWPHQHYMTNLLKVNLNAVTVYDCIDHLQTFTYYENIEEHHIAAIQSSDFIIATAKGIFDEVSQLRSDCILLPNGVNYDDFTSLLPNPKNDKSLTVGYYGAIAEWFDFELVEYVANRFPQINFKIVGEVYSDVQQEVHSLSKLINVKFLPRVSYSEIPSLLDTFDIAMLPFKLNDITLNTSPVKVFEYLAGGKVTVSTALPEIVGLQGVLISQDKDSFAANIEIAIDVMNDEHYTQQLRKTAQDHSWDNKVNMFLKKYSEERGLID